MTAPRDDSPDEPDAGQLGSEVSQPDPDDDAMAGPVYPPPETEPDAHEDSTRRGLGRLLHRGED